MDVHAGVFDHAVVEHDDVQGQQQLAFVLVHALDLHVEDGLGVDDQIEGVFDDLGQRDLVLLLDGVEFVEEAIVVSQGFEFFQFGQIADPCVADIFADERGRGWP